MIPIHGIDDGFFDDKSVPDGRRPPFPEKPNTNGHNTPRRGSIPPIFPYSPDFIGPGVVSARKQEPH